MKKRYLIIAILLMFVGMCNANALKFSDCDVLASFKLNSSLDESTYICKGKKFGDITDNIYYSGTGNEIKFNNFNAYYFTNYAGMEMSLNINGQNNIALLHLNDSKITIKGTGLIKFKEDSFVKKVNNGEAVYQFVYNGKTLINNDKKIYEATIKEFEIDYENLIESNGLPSGFKVDNFDLVQVLDYNKMTSVIVTESWINNHVTTELNIGIEDGFGVIKYEAPKAKENKLETENVILISQDKVNSKYELTVDDLKEKEIADKIEESIDDKSLVSFYDVNVYNGKKQVEMKNGEYTLKIKLTEDISHYKDYQIIYVNDNGEIEEYIDGFIEGEYIVFNTSHLSQYGVVASLVKQDVSLDLNDSKEKFNFGSLFKISLLLGIVILTSMVILFLLVKSDLLPKKKKKNNKKITV